MWGRDFQGAQCVSVRLIMNAYDILWDVFGRKTHNIVYLLAGCIIHIITTI